MPSEQRILAANVIQLHRLPTQLALLHGLRFAAQSGRQKLRAKAQAQHGNIGVMRHL